MTNNELPEDYHIKKQAVETEIKEITQKVSETFLDQVELQNELLEQLRSIQSSINRNYDVESAIDSAPFDVRIVVAKINRGSNSQLVENRLRIFVPIIIVFYAAMIILSIVYGGNVWQSMTEVPIIGVPYSVIIWAAIGSLAAILYRFYSQAPKRLTDEIKWLFARPVIGIIMGMLAYIAAVSGLVIFGVSTGTAPATEMPINTTVAHPQIFWIVAFLAGFSDNVFKGIIESLSAKLTTNEKTETNNIGES